MVGIFPIRYDMAIRRIVSKHSEGGEAYPKAVATKIVSYRNIHVIERYQSLTRHHGVKHILQQLRINGVSPETLRNRFAETRILMRPFSMR